MVSRKARGGGRFLDGRELDVFKISDLGLTGSRVDGSVSLFACLTVCNGVGPSVFLCISIRPKQCKPIKNDERHPS